MFRRLAVAALLALAFLAVPASKYDIGPAIAMADEAPACRLSADDARTYARDAAEAQDGKYVEIAGDAVAKALASLKAAGVEAEDGDLIIAIGYDSNAPVGVFKEGCIVSMLRVEPDVFAKMLEAAGAN